VSGRACAAISARGGKEDVGKKVPLRRNIGVISRKLG